MRLLEYNAGKFSLTRDLLPSSIPQYAILSHTWGPDTEEVTYQDMLGGIGEQKAGFEKIRFCAEQAAGDGLRYIWVDTCCIDKTNSAELNEAITSMFRWYEKATRCYVYLSDVSATLCQDGEFQHIWELKFRASKWFTRGWTLQELVAPASVEFFTKEGRRLGDKRSLEQPIHEVTGVAVSALRKTPLSGFSIEERFKWAATRHTTREEDWAYCLLGILDVSMVPNYGEGKTHAVRRLRKEIESQNEAWVYQKEADDKCLKDLYLTDPELDKKRIEASKGSLLRNVYSWVLDNPDYRQWVSDPTHQLLWIKGDPGKGKTMLLCGIIDELRRSNPSKLVSFFLCQATDSRINNATAVLRGLIYMLVVQQPPLITHVRKRYDVAGKTLFETSNAWVALSDIFTDILKDLTLKDAYLIIDALDECVADLPQLLHLITNVNSISRHIKWIVSSRNWDDIEESLKKSEQKVRLCLELNEESISAAVRTYIHYKVNDLAVQKNYDALTKDAVQQYLVYNATDTFLWVALVCEELASAKVKKRHTKQILHTYPPGLNALYKRMMDQIDPRDADVCRQILAILAITYRPLALRELLSLFQPLEDFDDNVESLEEIIGSCGSFLTVRKDVVYFVHQSAQDFLLKVAAAQIFPSGVSHEHHKVFSKSLRTLSHVLRRDIYNLGAPGIPIERISTPDPNPLASVRYSCVYWVDHFCNSLSQEISQGDDLRDGSIIYTFLQKNYLYWLEALSLLRSMSEGVVAVRKLGNLTNQMGQRLTDLVRDALRFILSHRWIIENAPLQLYVSALVFSPTQSTVRKLFQAHEPSWIILKPVVETNWNACLQTLEGHSSVVSSVAFSQDGTRLASTSYDRTIKLWDAVSGACVQTLEGHSGVVWSVAFSQDCTRLASASDDRTVKIWDAVSGACVQTLERHSGVVSSVAFSQDGTRLASTSYDRTVKIWDAVSGACVQTLEGHSAFVSSVAFSQDGTQLASTSYDRTVKIWDAASGRCAQSIDIGVISNNISFQGDYVLTDAGYIETTKSLPGPSHPFEFCSAHGSQHHQEWSRSGYGIGKDSTWITRNGENTLWLPPGYRPGQCAVLGRTVAISLSSGQVLIIAFS